MTKNRFLHQSYITFVLWAGTQLLMGQTSLSDTVIHLQQVNVLADKKQNDNNIGARTSSINSSVLQSTQTQTLGELLSENSLIYVKSLGQGGLSTSSFRGTSSNHTQVNWNGININPVMGGSFNFSQFPTFFTDEVTLFHGNTYLKNGTGALGGSINLNNRPNWDNNGERVKLLGEYGSNDTYTGGIAFRFAGKRLSSNTRIYYQQSDNDFRYLNKVLQKDPFYERREEANYWQGGAMQELYYKLSENHTLSTNLWFQFNKNFLPQPIMVNAKQHEEQTNKNWRYYLNYSGTTGKHEYRATFAYLHDKMDYLQTYQGGYEGSESSNKAESYIAKSEYIYHLKENLQIGSDISYRLDVINSSAYASNIKRNTITLQINTVWSPYSRTKLNLQLMGERNEKKLMPTFSAGIAQNLIENRLDIKGSIAYNYHYPTLNDLYWNPGGNPNLKPENGMAYDATVSFRPLIGNGNIRFKADLTYYLMTINNWIVWLPTEQGYIWSPQNLNKVLSHGAELNTELSFDTGIWNHRLTFNYGYSPSLNRDKKSDKDESYNKQLPYIPLNKWNGRYSVKFKRISLNYSISFTDVRFISTDNEYRTNAYTIHDAEVSYLVPLSKKSKIEAKLRVNNLFNAYYESTQYYPMPLRSFFGSIMYSF